VARKLLGIIMAWGLVGAVLVAADFWETKPFTMWSAEEMQKVLTDSPWSRTVNVVVVSPPGGGGLDGTEGAGGRVGGRGGGGAGVEGDGGGRGGPGLRVPPQFKVVISWRSALPMKQALVRGQIGVGGAVPAETQQLLERPEPMYVVTVVGVPARYARTINDMKAQTFLKRKNKPPLAVMDMGSQQAPPSQQTPASLVVVFGFPKTDAITVEDKEVEFVTSLGLTDIKKKFNLSEMKFHGQLEL
jgi:hypothetical protein